MYQLPQEIWNQIAQATHLETPAAKVAFSLTGRQAEEMMPIWENAEEVAGTPDWAISSLMVALPMLAEKDALAEWFHKHPEMSDLRQLALPEILSAREAALLMSLERQWEPAQTQAFQQILDPIGPALTRWQQSASKALEASEPPEPSE